jgi:hypothetical protein
MSQMEYEAVVRRGFWERLCDSLGGRREVRMPELPEDSLFATVTGDSASVADVPETVKAAIREEAVLDTFNRLEASLRLLLFATTPGKEPPSAERCQQILNVWRYELERSVNLQPDTYCGAVHRYEFAMENAYTIDGRCAPGDLLRIRVPCWKMRDRIVVRGEAEVVAQLSPEVNGQDSLHVSEPLELNGNVDALRRASDEVMPLDPTVA